MKTQVLRLLKEQNGKYVSGAEMSKQLGVSRTAIWKHIRGLRSDGYEIETHPHKGYCLQKTPDLLLPQEIMAGLVTQALGRTVHYRSTVDSTNNEAKKLAVQACPHGTLVIAEEQTGGRGRLSRSWFSPPVGGLWFSLVLRPQMLPQNAPKFTFLAAVAVCRAIRSTTGVQAAIKWPNDVLVNGKKVVGILTEMHAQADCIEDIIVGIGINVNIDADAFPPDLSTSATSLSIEDGHAVDRRMLLQSVLTNMEQLYMNVVAFGFRPVFTAWRELNCTLGQTVKVVTPQREFCGTAVDIGEDGSLLVDHDGIRETVIAGDVFVRANGNGGM